jgi:DNA-binding response OmpR family regulator
MARILVVDDEPHIVEALAAYLERDGHTVDTAPDGATALERCHAAPPDLVLLDVMLPGRSGFDVLREVRASGMACGVIMLTARDDLVDRVAGLEIGADDYVTKPFAPREVVARVGAVLRRMTPVAGGGGGGGGGATPSGGAGTPWPSLDPIGAPLVAHLDLVIDPAAREVQRGGTPVELTRVEFDILLALVEHPGIVLSRGQLGAAAFGEAFEAFDRSIDSHIKNLRHKLGDGPGGRPYIETVRGVGYRAARP